MKDITILVDLDNTCNNFSSSFIQRVKELGYDFDQSLYTTWRISNGIVAEKPLKVQNDILFDMSFWENLQPLPNSAHVLKKLNKEYTIKIVTAPWRATSVFLDSKRQWVKKHFPFLSEDQIIFESKKWLLPGDIIIDDKPEILQKCADSKITIKHTMKYNVTVDTDFSFHSWSEVPSLFNTIETLL